MRWGCESGTCQVCEGLLLQGRAHLKHSGQQLDVRPPLSERVLCCMLYPEDDLELEVPNVLAPGQFPIREITAQIIQVDQVSRDVKAVQLRLPAGKKVEFAAGQYLEVILDSETRAAFSIASAPREDRVLELHIRSTQDSDSYPLLRPKLKTGELLRLCLPMGNTTLLRLQQASTLILIAASTGYSQIKAMLEALVAADDTRPVHVYWGARLVEDLYQHDAMLAMAQRYEQIHYTPVVSDQPEWPGRKGLVSHAVLEDWKQFEGCGLVCGGSPGMVYATYDELVAAGMAPEQMVSDVFDYAPRT